MLTPARTTEATISAVSRPWPGVAARKTCAKAWWALAKLGCRNSSMKLGKPKNEPSRTGTPRKPARIEPNASAWSGRIMEAGDSWMCFSCSGVPRKKPEKVRL
jgi:hypothetical protein